MQEASNDCKKYHYKTNSGESPSYSYPGTSGIKRCKLTIRNQSQFLASVYNFLLCHIEIRAMNPSTGLSTSNAINSKK